MCRIIILNDGPTLYLSMFGATCIHTSVAGLSSYTRPHMLMGVQGGKSLAIDTVVVETLYESRGILPFGGAQDLKKGVILSFLIIIY